MQDAWYEICGRNRTAIPHSKATAHQRDVKNRVSTNGIYNHLKNNKKHKIAWDDAVFIDREPHFMRRKIKESIYINALDPSEKHSKIMNLEKGIATNPCWNEFKSEVRKMLRLWKIHADAISWEMSMYFHNDRWTFLCFCFWRNHCRWRFE